MIDPSLPTPDAKVAIGMSTIDDGWTPSPTSLRVTALELAVKTAVTSDAERTVDAAKKFYAFLTGKE